MSDAITPGYLSNRKAREDKEKQAIIDEMTAWQAKQKAALAQPQGATPAPTAAPEADKVGIGGVIRDSASAIAYAGTGLYDSAANMIYDAVDATASSLFDQRFLGRSDVSGMLEDTGFSKPQLVGGQIGKELVQWATPFAGVLKAANTTQKATTLVGKTAQATGAGAVADLSSVEQNLSRMMVDLGDKYPWMKNYITEALASDPNAPDYENRLRNLAEGGVLGAATETVFAVARPLLKAANGWFRANGKDALQSMQAEAEKVLAEQTIEAETQQVAKAVETKTPLQKQIEHVTGVKEQKTNWQKYLDVQAAVKNTEAVPPVKAGEYDPNLMKNAEGVEVQTPSRELTSAEKNEHLIKSTMTDYESSVTQGATPYRVLVDTADNTAHLSKEVPSGSQVDLGQEINKILRPGYSKDLAQESANVPVQTPSRDVGLAERNQAHIDATMKQYLEAYKKLQEEALGQVDATVKKIVPVADEAPRAWEAGDTVVYKGGAESGEVIKAGKNGKVVIKDDRTGKTMTVTPDADDLLVAEVKANDKKLKKVGGRKAQGGFIDPSVLAQLAAAQLGGVAGYMSADDDASMADKLALAGVYALGGMGLARVGMSKLKTAEEAKALQGELDKVEAMTRPEVQNIMPQAVTKKAPVITKDKVDKLIAIAKEGDFSKLADAAKESDFNFNNIDSAEDVKQMIDGFSSVFEKEIDKAKHGVQTHAQLRELADELGSGTSSLKELYGDTNNLGARIFAHRALLTASAEKVTSLAKLASAGDSTAILSLRKQVALHASIQAQMKGVQTEVARALSQFRLTSSSVDLAINERNMLIEAMGGHKANMDFAEKLAQITDPKKLAAVTRKGSMARTQDALYEAWVNGLLSSPVTHAVNFMGNSLVAVGSSAERVSAALIGKVSRVVDGGTETIEMGEAKAHLFGMIEGIMDTVKISAAGLDSLKTAAGRVAKGDFKGATQTVRENSAEFGNTWQAFGSDMPVLDNAAYGTKEFDLQGAAISGENLIPKSGVVSDALDAAGLRKHMEAFTDVMGTVARTPGRMLTASDELFKSAHYRGELKAQAYRIARGKGLSGDEFIAEVARLVDDPTPELSAQALSAARQGTFTSPLGQAGSLLQGAVHKFPGARYIIPFMRTPINIMKYVGVRTPGLNLMADSVRAEFKAGGVRRDMMLAKTATGGSMLALGGYLAAQGYIIGGGEKNREAEKLGGIQQYSVKIGDTYYSFNRLDPFGMFLGLAADFSEMSGMLDTATADDLASAAALAVSRNIVSKSYLSGLTKLIDTISSQDGDRWARYLRDMGSTFVPLSALSNTLRKEADPIVREVWTLSDALKNKIPGYSSDLPPHLNIFGEEVKYSGGLGVDIVSPIRTTDASTDVAATEIARLNLDIRPPPKSISGGVGAPPIELNQKQYHRLMQLVGEGFKPAIIELVTSESYQELPEDPENNTYLNAKETIIKKMYDGYKQSAVARLLDEDPSLMEKFQQSTQNRGNSFLGLPISPIEQ